MNDEVPGNSMGSQQAFEKQMIRAASQILRFENVVARLHEDAIIIKSISIRIPTNPGGDFLAVIRSDKDGSASVAFIASDTLLDVLRKATATLENKTAKWKDDKYD